MKLKKSRIQNQTRAKMFQMIILLQLTSSLFSDS